MCTATMHQDAVGLLVTMNRDELHTRAPEQPPRIFGDDGPTGRWIAPIDGETGGTWVGVNDCGLVALLLNAYLSDDTTGQLSVIGSESRGSIVPTVLAQGNESRVQTWMADHFDPAPYPPFHLVVVGLDWGMTWTWLGAKFVKHTMRPDEWTFMTSSLWNTEAVLAWRSEAFETWREAGCQLRGHLPAFHLLHESGREEWSPLMDREWGCTRSITQVLVDSRERRSVLRYWTRQARHGIGVVPTAQLELPLRHSPQPRT